MKRAKNVDEYVAMIREAIYEVDEMRAAIEYDGDFMAESAKYIDELEENLKEIFTAMQDGSYSWRTGDLKFMNIIADLDEGVIPFRSLLIRINDTHKNGVEPDEA